jgi:hypothetical protein
MSTFGMTRKIPLLFVIPLKKGIHSFCHSALDAESTSSVIPGLIGSTVIPDLIGDPFPFEFPGFPIDTFGNDKFTVIPDLIGDPLFFMNIYGFPLSRE